MVDLVEQIGIASYQTSRFLQRDLFLKLVTMEEVEQSEAIFEDKTY